jgi:hypothetical protein
MANREVVWVSSRKAGEERAANPMLAAAPLDTCYLPRSRKTSLPMPRRASTPICTARRRTARIWSP